MASLTEVAAYSIRSTIHDQNRDIMLHSLGIVVVKSGVSGGYGRTQIRLPIFGL